MKNWLWACLAMVILGLGVLVLPRGVDSLSLLMGPRDEAAVANYALASRTASDYARAIDDAVAAKDADLASSLLALADERGVGLPLGAREKVAAAEADATARMGSCLLYTSPSPRD